MAEMVKRKRRKTKKGTLTRGSPGLGYNRLEGDDRAWARSNQFYLSEQCVPVKDGKRFGGATWVKTKCGDGSMGFSTRRKGQDDVQMEVGLDGQYKKKRSTLVRPKSARCSASRRARRVDGSKCGLICLEQIKESQRDPIVVRAQRALSRLKNGPRRLLNRRERKERAETLSRLHLVAGGLA